RPGSAADPRPPTADAGALAPGASLLATARHPVLRARTPAVLFGRSCHARPPAEPSDDPAVVSAHLDALQDGAKRLLPHLGRAVAEIWRGPHRTVRDVLMRRRRHRAPSRPAGRGQ